MLRLRTPTDPTWIDVVLSDFDAFLIDHAACERKASATALKLVAHYSDRTVLVRELIPFAQEELEHYAQVMEIILDRGLSTQADEKDPYVGALMK
jgi:tRNA-(ms[2]io[6]A)-hydroxylase